MGKSCSAEARHVLCLLTAEFIGIYKFAAKLMLEGGIVVGFCLGLFVGFPLQRVNNEH